MQFLPGSRFGDIYAWTSHHVMKNPGHKERLCVGFPASNLAQVSGDSINCEGMSHLKMTPTQLTVQCVRRDSMACHVLSKFLTHRLLLHEVWGNFLCNYNRRNTRQGYIHIKWRI